MKDHGKWWVYFNSHAAAPLVWCISPEFRPWEVAVVSVEIVGVPSLSKYKPAAPGAAVVVGAPTAWIEVVGVLTIGMAGKATITAE